MIHSGHRGVNSFLGWHRPLKYGLVSCLVALQIFVSHGGVNSTNPHCHPNHQLAQNPSVKNSICPNQGSPPLHVTVLTLPLAFPTMTTVGAVNNDVHRARWCLGAPKPWLINFAVHWILWTHSACRNRLTVSLIYAILNTIMDIHTLTSLWPIFVAFVLLIVTLAQSYYRIQVLEEKMRVAFELLNKLRDSKWQSSQNFF